MGVINQTIKEKYALYNSDCMEVMKDLKSDSVDMVIYSPPFASMYTYSSSDRDLGNNRNYDEFIENYKFVINEISRILKPGLVACVHCMDLPLNGDRGLVDFPGDIIKLHKDSGFHFWDRKNIWKEPLRVAIRTRQRALMHQQLCKDTMKCRGALADYLLIFKKKGENKIPVVKEYGLTEYDGDIELMNEIERAEYKDLINAYVQYKDDKTNRLSQFIWRRYASSAWEDIRANRCVTYKEARDPDDDRHVCPLQLDIITRSVVMYTNKGEVVFTPFMGVGSEVVGALLNGRKGIGVELKESYYRQAVKNIENLKEEKEENYLLFNEVEDTD